MGIKEILKRMGEIHARRQEIRKVLESDANADLSGIETELRNLDTEYIALEQRKQIIEGIGNGTISTTPVENPVDNRSRTAPEEEPAEYRSAWLKSLQGKPLTVGEQRAMQEYRAYSTAPESALPAVPQETANEIIKKMYEVSPILARCRIFHVPGNFRIAVEGANSEAKLHTENAQITPDSDSLGEVSLTGYEVTKLISASRATLSMTVSAFESFIVDIVSEALARKLENCIFTGTGNNQPGGVAQGGKGANGAYTAGTDMVEVAAGTDLTEENVTALYGMLASGYERNAVWAMSKTTFFAYFYPLMNLSKNNIITQSGNKWYILGNEVYFTGSLPKGTSYLGDYHYIIGNFSQEVGVVKSEHSGLTTNSVHYLGSCVFDSKPVQKFGAFVKLNKKQA